MANEIANLNQEKFKAIDCALFDEYVLIHLTPKIGEVVVPDHLGKQNTVSLKISRLFRGRLELLEDRLETDLLFSGEYVTCIIPFDAVWGLTSEKGNTMVWPENAPEEVLKEISAYRNDRPAELSLAKGASAASPAKTSRPMLKRVK